MSDVYINLEGKNTFLAVDVQKAKLFMNQFFQVTDKAKIPSILQNCATNNKEIRALLSEMESIVDKSDSAVLKTKTKEYSALLKDFIVVFEDLAKAVEADQYYIRGDVG